MIDLDKTIGDGLERAARSVTIPAGDVDLVLERTRRRQWRKRATASVVTVAAVTVAGVGVVQLRDDTPTQRQVVTATQGSTAVRGDTGVHWRSTAALSALGMTSTASVGGSLYALSTAPGQAGTGKEASFSRVLYRSDDGVNWTPAGPLASGLFAADLAGRGDRLYAVGTGPASATTRSGQQLSGLVAGWSDDGGKTWSKTDLPMDIDSVSKQLGSMGVMSVKVAAGDIGVVAIASLNGEVDIDAVLPAGVTAPNGWATTASGIDILASSGPCPAGMHAGPKEQRAPVPSGGKSAQVYSTDCFSDRDQRAVTMSPQAARGVSRSLTWSELRVSDDTASVLQRKPLAFQSKDGTHFDRVNLGVDQVGMIDVAADGDGFTVVAARQPDQQHSEAVLLRSSDGRTWASSPNPFGAVYTTTIGQIGGRLAVMGSSPAGPSLFVLDGGAWRTVRLQDAIDPAELANASVELVASATGPLGVVAVVMELKDPIAERGGVSVTTNGYTLHLLDQRWAAVVTDKSGTEVARTSSLQGGDTGRLHMDQAGGSVILADDTGAPVVTFSADDVKSAFASAFDRSESKTKPRHRLLFSPDGITWSSHPIEDLVDGEVGGIGAVTMTPNSAIVTVTAPADSSGRPGPATVLIGTT